MSDNTNIVTLTLSSYNNIKSENTKLNMVIASIIRDSTLSEDHTKLVFDSDKVGEAISFCFPEDYKKKIATLRTMSTKKGNPT